jgi:hypothetical protein
MLKKVARKSMIQVDENRPAKVAAPPPGARISRKKSAEVQIPTYEGPTKTKKAPEAEGNRIKAAVRAADLKNLKASSTQAYPDQQASRDGVEQSATPEQYIRMRIRFDNGRLAVIDSHLVDGPLALPTSFPGTHAYEVSLDDRLLHAGALPDLGVQRSFVNPRGPREQHGHHFAEREIFEFMARVPAHEVTSDTIKRIAVRLHRVKGEARAERMSGASLRTLLEREMRPVAELVGLPDSVLPRAIEQRGARTPSVPGSTSSP